MSQTDDVMCREKKNFECISLLCLLEKQKVAEAAQGICTTYGKNVILYFERWLL